MTLLGGIAPAIPSGRIPLVQAHCGIGTSPELLQLLWARRLGSCNL